jgi:hypothetical protein
MPIVPSDPPASNPKLEDGRAVLTIAIAVDISVIKIKLR